jgi:hypothetical protein
MPRYRVTAPDGRRVTLTGSQPPSQADLDAIFAALPPRSARPAAPSPQPEETPLWRKAADAVKVPLEVIGTPFRGLGMLADVTLSGGLHGSRVKVDAAGEVSAPSIPQIAVESVRRRAAALDPFNEANRAPARSLGEAVNRSLAAVTGIQFGEQDVAGQEEHIRDAWERHNPGLATAEAVAEPIAELGVGVLMDPVLAGFLKAGKLAEAGARAERILATSRTTLDPRTVAMFERIATTGRAASLGQKAAGAAMVPGMAVQAGESLGAAAGAALDNGITPDSVREAVGGAGSAGMALLGGSHAARPMPGRPVRQAVPADVAAALEAAGRAQPPTFGPPTRAEWAAGNAATMLPPEYRTREQLVLDALGDLRGSRRATPAERMDLADRGPVRGPVEPSPTLAAEMEAGGRSGLVLTPQEAAVAGRAVPAENVRPPAPAPGEPLILPAGTSITPEQLASLQRLAAEGERSAPRRQPNPLTLPITPEQLEQLRALFLARRGEPAALPEWLAALVERGPVRGRVEPTPTVGQAMEQSGRRLVVTPDEATVPASLSANGPVRQRTVLVAPDGRPVADVPLEGPGHVVAPEPRPGRIGELDSLRLRAQAAEARSRLENAAATREKAAQRRATEALLDQIKAEKLEVGLTGAMLNHRPAEIRELNLAELQRKGITSIEAARSEHQRVAEMRARHEAERRAGEAEALEAERRRAAESSERSNRVQAALADPAVVAARAERTQQILAQIEHESNTYTPAKTRAADLNPKELYGLDGRVPHGFGPKKIAAAIREDGDNPVYLAVKERAEELAEREHFDVADRAARAGSDPRAALDDHLGVRDSVEPAEVVDAGPNPWDTPGDAQGVPDTSRRPGAAPAAEPAGGLLAGPGGGPEAAPAGAGVVHGDAGAGARAGAGGEAPAQLTRGPVERTAAGDQVLIPGMLDAAASGKAGSAALRPKDNLSDSPLFTQEREARARAEEEAARRAQRPMFGGEGGTKRQGEVGAVLLRSRPAARVLLKPTGEEGRAIGFTPDGQKIVVEVGRSRYEADPRELEYLGVDQPNLYGKAPAQRMAAANDRTRPEPMPRAGADVPGRLEAASQARGGRTTGKPPEERFNLDRMGISDEAKAEFSRQMDALDPELEQAQGKRSFEEIASDTRRLLGITTQKELEYAARHGLLGTAQGHLAVRRTLQTLRADLTAARQRVTEAQRSGQGVQEAQDAAAAAALKFGNFMLAAKGAQADAARALASYRIFSEPLTTAEKALHEAVRRKTLTPEQMAELVKTAELAPQNLGPVLSRILRRSYGSKFLELYKAGLLSAPPTHMANAIGNTVKSVLNVGEAAFTSWVTEPLAAKAQGRAVERVHGEAAAMTRATAEATPAAMRQFLADLRSALTLGEEKIDFDSGRKLEHQVGAIGGPGGRAVRIPFRLLQAADDFFRAIGEAQERSRQARRGGPVDEGKVTEAGRVATFQETPGDVAQAIMGLKAKHGALDVALPFTRTPANIFRQTVARTPFGLRQVWKAYQAYKAGKIAGGEFSDAITQPLLGTILGGGFLALAKAGLLTGSGPTDKREASLRRETGWQPYSVVLPGPDGRKQFISYTRFEPLSSIVGMAADLAEAGKPELTDDYMRKVGGSVAANLTSKTWLENLRQIVELFTDPYDQGGDFVQKLAGSLVPAAVARTARAIDPVIRERGSIKEEMQARVPFASRSLQPRYTATGEEMRRSGTALERFASPADRSVAKPNAHLEQLLSRIGFVPSLPSKQARVGGESIALKPEQYRRLVTGNREASDFIRQNYLGDPEFQALPDTMDEGGKRSKEHLIRQVYDRFRDRKRSQLTTEIAQARRRLAALSALR